MSALQPAVGSAAPSSPVMGPVAIHGGGAHRQSLQPPQQLLLQTGGPVQLQHGAPAPPPPPAPLPPNAHGPVPGAPTLTTVPTGTGAPLMGVPPLQHGLHPLPTPPPLQQGQSHAQQGSLQAAVAPGQLLPPIQRGSPSRVAELLDLLKTECDHLTQEASAFKMQREDFENKMTAQIGEMNLFQQVLYELERTHNKVKQQYEEEIMRLRRELDQRSGSRHQPPPQHPHAPAHSSLLQHPQLLQQQQAHVPPPPNLAPPPTGHSSGIIGGQSSMSGVTNASLVAPPQMIDPLRQISSGHGGPSQAQAAGPPPFLNGSAPYHAQQQLRQPPPPPPPLMHLMPQQQPAQLHPSKRLRSDSDSQQNPPPPTLTQHTHPPPSSASSYPPPPMPMSQPSHQNIPGMSHMAAGMKHLPSSSASSAPQYPPTHHTPPHAIHHRPPSPQQQNVPHPHPAGQPQQPQPPLHHHHHLLHHQHPLSSQGEPQGASVPTHSSHLPASGSSMGVHMPATAGGLPVSAPAQLPALEVSATQASGDELKRKQLAVAEHTASYGCLPAPYSSMCPSSSSAMRIGTAGSVAVPPANSSAPPLASGVVVLGDIDPDLAPSVMKRMGQDWYAVFNPNVPRVLDVGVVHNLEHSSVVCCVRFSHDGKLVATGCNRTAQIFDVINGQKVCKLVDDSASKDGDLYIRSVCFSPDGRYLATGAEDKQIRVWDIAKKTIFRLFPGHDQDIYSLDFSKDGRLVVSGSGDRTAMVWDMETGNRIHTLVIEETGSKDAGVTSVAISPDGRLVAAGSLDKMVRVWDAATGQFLDRLDGHKDSVYSVAFSHDGRNIVSGSLDKTIKMWDLTGLLDRLATANVGGSTTSPSPGKGVCRTTFIGHKDFVLSVACSPCGKWVVSGSKDRGVQFWDPRTAQAQFMLQGHKNSVISVALSPTGGLFATGSGDCRARVWKYDESLDPSRRP